MDDFRVFVRAPYNYDTDAVSRETALYCEDESLAKQSFAEEVDINTILRRFHITGELPSGVRMPTYGDFEGVTDFHEAVNAIALAHEAFDQMPADVRLRFNNDPGAFVDFCSDDKNREEAMRLGLIPPAPKDNPPPADGGSPPPADGSGTVST